MSRVSIFTLIPLVFASCAVAPEITKSEAVRIANAEMRRRGYDLISYAQPTVSYNVTASSDDDRWWVSYERRGVKNHLGDTAVIIKGATKEVWGFNVAQ